ncbi:unnamed protein product [Didymodactylos carnosus]|uniref:Cation efflux protein cytoplasmic domain-containing protein n=1 Tax=Didymodactylos carnosus TaxID=1234261 RepID=A0A8S2IMZ3_9BILA|nr:unnamed protein product [Didymodactylos carnosus]CAF3767096.1 unnamed protein product [Didymodactylos carnosus]
MHFSAINDLEQTSQIKTTTPDVLEKRNQFSKESVQPAVSGYSDKEQTAVCHPTSDKSVINFALNSRQDEEENNNNTIRYKTFKTNCLKWLNFELNTILKATLVLTVVCRPQLESLCLFSFSIIQCLGSALLIIKSLITLHDDVKYFYFDSKILPEIDITYLSGTVMSMTIGIKIILFLLCALHAYPTTNTLKKDHRNDIASNVVAIICGIIASFAYKKLINEGYIIIDRLGAIGISVYIVHCWLKEGIRLVKRLSYHTADEDIRKKVIETVKTQYHRFNAEIGYTSVYSIGTKYEIKQVIKLHKTSTLEEITEIHNRIEFELKKILDIDEIIWKVSIL